jgi:hypothetical protein
LQTFASSTISRRTRVTIDDRVASATLSFCCEYAFH